MKRTRLRGPSLLRRTLRTLSAVTVTVLALGAATVLGATAAHATSTTSINIVPLANASSPHGQFSAFQYNVSYSCSASSGAGCAGAVIRVPVALEPRVGQVERFDSWTMSAQLAASSAAGFTQTWETSATTRTLVLTASKTITAGVQESFALTIQPPLWAGNDVRFTVGVAQFNTTNGQPAVSNSHTATVTNIALDAPVLRAESGYRMSTTDATQIVTYAFDPKINNILTASGSQYVFGAGDVHSAATPNVTARYETIDLEFDIPVGSSLWSHTGQAQAVGTIPFPPITTTGSGSTVSTYALVQNGNTVKVTLPAHKLPTDVIRFTLEYPATMAGQAVCLPGNRTFTATNGDEYDDDVSVCHTPNYQVLQAPAATKCGHGAVSAAGPLQAGMCSASVMAPVGWTTTGAGSPSSGRYVLAMRNSHAGDRIVFEDFMPCFDTPGTATVAESFAPAQLCANPTVKIVGIEMGVEPVAGPYQRFTDGTYYQLINNDGTIATGAIASTDPFPAQPSSGYWSGIRVLVEGAPVAGTVMATIHVEALAGVNREMILQNHYAADVTRMTTDTAQHISASGVGIIRVRDVLTASARANFSHATGAHYATVSGSYTLGRLDPGVATPVHTLQLPAGFDLRYANLSTFTVQYNGAGARMPLTDHYDVTIVPEDAMTNTGPRLVMTPKPGTPAIPANRAGWPTVSVQGQMEPTTGQWNTTQTVTAAISVDGDARQIESCTSGATHLSVDPSDRDSDGITTGDTSCQWAHTALLGIPNEAASANATKSVRDATDGTWTSGTAPVAVTSGEMEYLLTWSNTGQPSLENVVMYDLLPTIGDVGALSATMNTPRGSTFAPTFTGIIGIVPAGMQIAYSASSNPCRPEVRSSNPGCDDDWTAMPGDLGGLSEVTALRLTMAGTQRTGTSYSLRFGMSVPETAIAGQAAWNSVAYSSSLNGHPLPAVETSAVGAAVMHNVLLSKQATPNSTGGSEFAVGDDITYTIAAVNEYGANVEPVIVSDDLSDVLTHAVYNGDAVATLDDGTPVGAISYDAVTRTLTWTGDLGPKERVSITYTVTATRFSTGSLTNTVTGVANNSPTNCNTGDEPACFADVSFYPVPSVAIDKTAPHITTDAAILSGTTVLWHYLVTNTGTEDLTITSVTDSRGVAVTCDAVSVAVGETVRCSGQGPVFGDPTYENTGTVIAQGAHTRQSVQATDTWTTDIEQLTTAVAIVKTAQNVVEGSEVEPNQVITWEYRVNNTGTDTITSITVRDDQGVLVACPAEVNIAPGEFEMCHGTGSVGYAATYTNVATVTATGGVTATTATASDDWSALVRQQRVGLQIDKVADGIAETDSVVKDTVVNWRYVITNPGEEPVNQIAVTDSQGVPVMCGFTELAPLESRACTGSGSVGSGSSYTNVGYVTGVSTLTGRAVAAEDTWRVQVRDRIPSMILTKGATNAVDGGSLLAGTMVNWNYTITNTGEEAITDLAVLDDQGVEVTCPNTTVAVGDTVTCTGSARIGNVGSYTNVGTATGVGVLSRAAVVASDEWTSSIDEPVTAVSIVKQSTSHDRTVSLPVNTEVTWSYIVMNTGTEALVDVAVTDDQGVEVTCEDDVLEAGQSMTCFGIGSVGASVSYTNVGTVNALGEVTGHTAASEDTWTVTLVRPASVDPNPSVPSWPQVPAVDEQPLPRLPLTGTAGLELITATGCTVVVLGLVMFFVQRRRLRS